MSAETCVAVITGGTGNLGRVVTERFLREGREVAVPWHKEEEWKNLQEGLDPEMPGRCWGIQVDLTDEDQVKDFVDKVMSRFGRIDHLLNLVGGFSFGSNIWEIELRDWERMMDMNLRTCFLCCKHALPPMLEAGAGSIVNVSSKACEDIQPGAAAYAVAKGGVRTFTRALREELKGTGVTANAIMPSIIDTPVTRELMPDASPEKWVRPEQIASVLLWLCGGGSEAVSGSVLRLFGEL